MAAMARLGGAPAWTTWVALILGCSSTGEAPDAPSGVGGAGGAGSATSGAVATSAGAGGAGGGNSGGAPFVCDPPAEPGSLYAATAVSYDLDAIDPVSMCQYRGEVLLIANTAAL